MPTEADCRVYIAQLLDTLVQDRGLSREEVLYDALRLYSWGPNGNPPVIQDVVVRDAIELLPGFTMNELVEVLHPMGVPRPHPYKVALGKILVATGFHRAQEADGKLRWFR